MSLFTFGCSNTAYYHTDTPTYKQYYEFRGGKFPPTWSELLSEKLNFKLYNYAISGCGNDSIVNQFFTYLNEIKKDDVVIIGWTFLNRFMWTDTINNGWSHIGHSLSGKEDISETTHQEIIKHRALKPISYLYIKNIHMWMKTIDYISNIIGFKVFYWACEGEILTHYWTEKGELLHRFTWENDNSILIKEKDGYIFDYVKKNNGCQILEETDNLILDHHWGQTGHEVISEKFYNHIVNITNISYI